MHSSYGEKPMPHSTTGQWHSSNRNMETITDMRSRVSDKVRQTGAQIRNATENTVRWKLKETNRTMKERMNEVDKWYDNLESSLTDLKDQIQRLTEVKVALEGSLEDLLLLQEAAKEVILLRDRRREIDLVEDEPYRQIMKELKLIDKARNEFCRFAHECWEQLLTMKEHRDKLVADLENKANALKIDKYKLSLTPESSGDISFKPRPLDLPEDTVNTTTWLRNCVQKNKECEAIVVKAMQLTNNALATLKTMLDDVQKQRESTQKALRKRLHETAQTRDKLGIQRANLMNEVDKAEREMKDIEATIAEKMMGNMKLVETRLENRKWRRGNELCSDASYEAMMDELGHVQKSKATLEQHLADVRNNLNCLRYQLHQVEDDLERKERSLAIESGCLDAHTRPPKAPYQRDLAWRAANTSLEFSALSPDENAVGDTLLEEEKEVAQEEIKAKCEDKATMTAEVQEQELLLS